MPCRRTKLVRNVKAQLLERMNALLSILKVDVAPIFALIQIKAV